MGVTGTVMGDDGAKQALEKFCRIFDFRFSRTKKHSFPRGHLLHDDGQKMEQQQARFSACVPVCVCVCSSPDDLRIFTAKN